MSAKIGSFSAFALAGVPLDKAKRLARHSDVRLTEDIYTDFSLLDEAEREAAEMLVPERRRWRFVPEEG